MSSSRPASLPADAPGNLEVEGLPSYGYGARSPTWWGLLCLMMIEGTVFALALMTYFYLKSLSPVWPPGGEAPALAPGLANLALMLASLAPNALAARAARRADPRATRGWLLASTVFALAALVLRGFEFGALRVDWNTNAYGSVIWLLMALHTTHLITDAVSTGVLAALFHIGPLEGRRFPNASENALYWYFVVGSWIPIFATVYGAARL
ncbi:cytochrome c oxidase subunit 3 [Burkholderia gladioli]|uniref:cytochrome c oxidase subunit 3 n=1 Tax=Burkholderia gladioli TaxID=28095 RepID=UPI000F52BC67|nr:cytochrome C oxidase subunit III [Burkholderia gladioli]